MNNMSSQRGGAGGSGNVSQSGGANKPVGSSMGSSMSGSNAGAAGAVRQAAGEMKEQTASVTESAKNMASEAGDKLVSAMEQQKAAGADFVRGMAGAMRRAANEFGEVPQAAQYIRAAADQIDSVSDAFKRRDLNQLVADVQDFARRQPTAFMGAAVLAGFAVMRFLKTSTANPTAHAMGGHYSRPNQGYTTHSQPMMEGHPQSGSSANWSHGSGMS
jgi:hypothetical protein